MNKRNLEAVIFDVDGTIANTEELHLSSYNKSFEQLNINWKWSDSDYQKLLSISGGVDRLSHFNDLIDGEYSTDQIRKIHQLKTKIYLFELEKNSLKLRTGIIRLLKELRDNGIKLAIATTTSRCNVKALLSSSISHDAINWFDVIGSGENAKIKKPSPEIYNYVLDKLNINSEGCIAIEDSFNGLNSATSAGIKCVVTYNSDTENQNFEQACLVVDSLGEADLPIQNYNGNLQGETFVTLATLKSLI